MSIPVFIPVSNPEEDSGGGGGPTIYTGDRSLTGNRIVTLGGFALEFKAGDQTNGPLTNVEHDDNNWYATSSANGLTSTTLLVSSTAVTYEKNSGGFKEVATITSANGTFTTVDAKTVTVVNGIITAITD